MKWMLSQHAPDCVWLTRTAMYSIHATIYRGKRFPKIAVLRNGWVGFDTHNAHFHVRHTLQRLCTLSRRGGAFVFIFASTSATIHAHFLSARAMQGQPISPIRASCATTYRISILILRSLLTSATAVRRCLPMSVY